MTQAVFKYFKLTAIFVILIENIAPVSILLQIGVIVQSFSYLQKKQLYPNTLA